MAGGLMSGQPQQQAGPQAMQQGAAPTPEQQMGGRPMAPGEGQAAGMDAESNVSPEEQTQYDQFVGNAMKLIYSKQGLPTMLSTLQGDGDAQEGLANTALTVVTRLEESAEENGTKLSPDVMMHGGLEIVEDLANLQREAGIADLSEQEIEGSFYRALDMYREQATAQGKLNPEEFQGDFQMMAQADQEGRLDEVVPGASQAAERLARAAPAGGEA